MAAFPNNPTNGQQATVNGITYTYTVPPGVWAVTTTAPSGNATVSQLNAVTVVASSTVSSAVINSTGTMSATGNITGGNVIATTRAGIGTATPVSGYPLTAFDSINGGIVIQNSTNFTGIAQNGGDVYFDIGRGGSAGTLFFRNSSVLTEQMRLNSAGNLGVGTNPVVSIDAGSRTDAIRIPVGTTAQRPGSPTNGMIRYNTSVGGVEFYTSATGQWASLSPFVASGGTVTTYSSGGVTYQVHTFTTSGTFTVVTGSKNVDYLIVAGGGGGGGRPFHGGGGGAGGVLTGTVTLSVSTNSIVIGAGGTGYNTASDTANNGQNTTALGFTAIAGGGGGGTASGNDGPGNAGGSGGGASVRNASGGAGTAGQGNAGGPGQLAPETPNYGAGGGGGAGGAGGAGTQTTGGNGGAGISNSLQTGSGQFYAGGGGGSVYAASTSGAGGSGIGGAGAYGPGGGNGVANTGSGGGGRDSRGGENKGSGNGGSGIVIIRYVI